MSVFFAAGATSQSIDVQVVDDAGLPVSGLAAATFPTVKYRRAGANADATLTLADLASATASWASGGVWGHGEGCYRLDLPNAALASAGCITVRGEATNKRLIAPTVMVGVLDGIPAAVRDVSNASPATGSLGAAVNAAGSGGADVWTEDEKDEALSQLAKIGSGAVQSISPVASLSGVTEIFKGATFSGTAVYSFTFETQDTLTQPTTYLSISDLADEKLVDIQASSVAHGGGNEWTAAFAVAAADTAALPLGKPVRLQISHVPSGQPGRPVAKGKGVVAPYYKGQA